MVGKKTIAKLRANFRHRGTLESWHTAMIINADNNAKHLPEQYRFLLQ